jgi:hypothetical protein
MPAGRRHGSAGETPGECFVVAPALGELCSWYADLEVLDHRQDISDATDEVSDGTNARVRADARKRLPMLRTHLEPLTHRSSRPADRVGRSGVDGYAHSMTTAKQRQAARSNVRKAQAGAKTKQTLKHLDKSTRSALGKEANAVRRGDEPTRKELEAQARRFDISGRSKMGKSELKRAVARAKG